MLRKSSSSIFLYVCLMVLLLATITLADEVELENDKPINYRNRMLVVLESTQLKTSHSKFFEGLKKAGFTIEFKLAFDSVSLMKYGENLYDHLLIMAPKAKKLGGDLEDANKILNFIDRGHNVFIVAHTGGLSQTLRKVAADSGIELDDDGTNVIDHFNYDVKLDSDKHTTIVIGNEKQFPSKKTNILGDAKFSQQPVLYRGLGMLFKPTNKLLVPILRGASTSYSYSTSDERVQSEPLVKGRDTILVGGNQARNGARLTIVGSMDLLSNEFFDASVTQFSLDGNHKTFAHSGNELFAMELSKWAFQGRGLLRHTKVHHYLADDPTKTQPSAYRVGQELTYTVAIEEWNGKEWTPFIADDIQVEFVMLHPYQRQFLKYDPATQKYTSTFKAPDTYGVYKFVVDYRRQGYNQLIFSDQVTVRPMHINEFERFVPAAYPYYTSVFVMMGAFFVFVILLTFTEEKRKED
ncbi:hypothetical protein FDP41_003804 [Naegleria fowleri]|uniref:Dolichyl-diphosphooligosaccharide--protein glycosyltransferase 48 kDa subunit n=1 Tax=Naegleria fowleri TaxID=5763 RepID=A0A6A5BS64_NAEFO|nr:uncharacterized protein FDP41_003804 [Naegleria fowleri]KAF0977151.1 hypothetical protein FDP41_003804 [Naegleria fowleri]